MVATRSLLVITALALAPACTDDGSTTVIVDDPVDETVAEGEARGLELADLAFSEIVGNDYAVQIGLTGSIIGAIHDGVILEADFAAQVVVDDDIFVFANDLIIDHDDGNIELDAVMRSYGIGYVPSGVATAMAAEASSNVGVLRSSSDVDFEFVEIEVINHAQALVLLDELYAIVGDGEIGDYIIETQNMVDDHLAEAEGLLSTYY